MSKYNSLVSRVSSRPSVRRRPNLPMRRWITHEEFEALIESGVLAPEERLELIAGELTQREPVNTSHAVAVVIIGEIMSSILPKGMHLRIQLPLVLGEYDEPLEGHKDHLHGHPKRCE